MRMDWDEYFMTLATSVAERGTCKRLKVGAVIVDEERRIIGTGYNGSIHGHLHCVDIDCITNHEGRCIATIHAEMNAILQAERHLLKGSTIYTTHEPCENCAKHIAQAGIAKVVYLHEYKNKYNQYFFQHMEVVKL